MPELAQWMIDGGATFFDAAGNPTRPDGTPVIDQTPQMNLGMGPPEPWNPPPGEDLPPQSYAIGPPYTASSKDYSGPAPLDPGIWNDMYMGAEEYAPGQLRYEGGVPMPVNWQDYKGNASSGGGFFTLAELYGQNLPGIFQLGSDMPSTNNWRLIPGGRPGMVMRNGQIIDPTSTNMYGPQGGSHTMGEERGGGYPRWRGGSTTPVAYATGPIGWGVSGWPGQLGNYQWHTTPGT